MIRPELRSTWPRKPLELTRRTASPPPLPAEEIAKGNTNASIGDRLSAGVDAIGNKADESKQCVATSWSLSPLPSPGASR